MANFASITTTLNPHNVAKPSVTLECRRYLPANARWSVAFSDGFGCEKPVAKRLSREKARAMRNALVAEWQE